jgi:hypothetical protein
MPVALHDPKHHAVEPGPRLTGTGQYSQQRRRSRELSATCYFRTFLTEAAVEQVWATLIHVKWFVSFGKVMPPDVVESPGRWCVTVDAETGQAEWFPTL